MSSQETFQLPSLPVHHSQFIPYLEENHDKSVQDLVQPFKAYEAKLREVYAQQPDSPAAKDSGINLVPIYGDHHPKLVTRARNLEAEAKGEKEKYLLPLDPKDRRKDGDLAVVQSLKDFQTNFGIFSESSLVDLDWDNVVAAGSSVVTALMPVPEEYAKSKRTLREYYHEIVAPASDVDLFLYGLTEEQAVEKIKSIERSIRDSVLSETTTIRTKNAITIASQYPTRHVQIVLRIYSNISEILTGFDVDCSCAVYDGKQVYASPRAIASYVTQINSIDLTRRSPSYENRLSKYSRRGFEVYWPQLERSRIDPTIFERSFPRTLGLARLLVLEKLPKESDRETYIDQRRRERGRPAINRYNRFRHRLHGNVKNDAVDEVAEWVEGDELSNYHTFTVPYGLKYTPKKIEKLLYTKDLLLNAEWNRSEDREVYLHRHPAFFGHVEDVIGDCCGFCPAPVTDEEVEVSQEEQKYFVSGNISFLKDDPGRQAIGSFHPITDDDWTDMAYVGNVAGLFNAIVDHDLEYVENWFKQDDSDPNQRDHTGKTPLQLATMCSTVEIVQCLIEHGARLIARMVDGKTALHLAAQRGNTSMIKAILRKSEENEEEQMKKEDLVREAKRSAKNQAHVQSEDDSDLDQMEGDEDYEQIDMTTENSFVKVKAEQNAENALVDTENDDEPDVFDVNVVAWDSQCSALHLAVINGHTEAAAELVGNFGADVLLPVKLVDMYHNRPRGAILNLVLPKRLPKERAKAMVKKLLDLGASSAQADINHVTALQYLISAKSPTAEIILEHDRPNAVKAIKNLSGNRNYISNCLTISIDNRDFQMFEKLIEAGARLDFTFEDFAKVNERSMNNNWGHLSTDSKSNMWTFRQSIEQPIIKAANADFPKAVSVLIQHGVDLNTLTANANEILHNPYRAENFHGETLYDLVQWKIKSLKAWHHSKPELPKYPKELDEDHMYLSAYQPGTYSYWRAANILNAKKEESKRIKELYESTARQRDAPPSSGAKAKEEAINALLKQFEELESFLVKNGAKSFYQLHPNLTPPEEQKKRSHSLKHDNKETEFSIELTFQVSDLTDVKRDAYVDIFEAAWKGENLDLIKMYTLGLWGPEGKKYPPLKITIADSYGMSPLLVALSRGRYNIARGILEIAHAQYKPDTDSQRTFFDTRAYSEDDEASTADSDDDLHIFSHIVDEEYTVENIGEVQDQVKSQTSVHQDLARRFNLDLFLRHQQAQGKVFNEKVKKFLEDNRSQSVPGKTLLEYSILTDNIPLFDFIISSFSKFNLDPDKTQASFLLLDEYNLALRYGSVAMLKTIIQTTGGGMPLTEMIQQSGLEFKERPRYYQGLSVYGKKRRDWAEARLSGKHYNLESSHSPVLASATSGNLEATEWFMTEEPVKLYCNFANRNKTDKRIQTLSRAPGGVERAMKEWLNSRNDLQIHCAMLAKPCDSAHHLFKSVLTNASSLVNAQTPGEGRTPLHLAYSLSRPDLARALLLAGADQECIDFAGNNVLHYLLVPMSYRRLIPQHLRHFNEMVSLIKPETMQELCIQRCADNDSPQQQKPLKPGHHGYYRSYYYGSGVSTYGNGPMTPLAKWLSRHSREDPADELARSRAILRRLLDLSKGEELEILDGAGDTPLHYLVRSNLYELADVVLARRPDLLWQENATGRTPLEMAEDAWVNEQVKDPPKVPESSGLGYRHYSQNRSATTPAILNRSEESFVASTIDEFGFKNSMTSAEKTWRMCHAAAEKVESKGIKRKLVTLWEANEVARRLAKNKRPRKNEPDVVEQWYEGAVKEMESTFGEECDLAD